MRPNVVEPDSLRENSAPESFASLRRFARASAPVERCELCGAELAAEHRHLLNRISHQAVCSCDACAILFCGQQGSKFLRIPRRIVNLRGFSIPNSQWEAMMLPINLAFFVRQPDGGAKAMYPSPAGMMESLIELSPWSVLCGDTQLLANAEAEVEALLVNRIANQPSYFLVPIDACYRLIGLIRTQWRGLSGGSEVRHAIAGFFGYLEKHALSPGEPRHA